MDQVWTSILLHGSDSLPLPDYSTVHYSASKISRGTCLLQYVQLILTVMIISQYIHACIVYAGSSDDLNGIKNNSNISCKCLIANYVYSTCTL